MRTTLSPEESLAAVASRSFCISKRAQHAMMQKQMRTPRQDACTGILISYSETRTSSRTTYQQSNKDSFVVIRNIFHGSNSPAARVRTLHIRGTAMPGQRMHARSPTFPLYHSTRKKPRRWPLVLRFIKGAIHVDIAVPVILSALWAAFIVYLDHVRDDHIGLPGSIIPSLSIVVGLMLVFRNQTSYDRFWQVG